MKGNERRTRAFLVQGAIMMSPWASPEVQDANNAACSSMNFRRHFADTALCGQVSCPQLSRTR